MRKREREREREGERERERERKRERVLIIPTYLRSDDFVQIRYHHIVCAISWKITAYRQHSVS
jgi:hypothetical protein